MPLYLDVHRFTESTPTAEEVEQAHLADLEVGKRHGVDYLKYWFDGDRGTAFCLVDAPDPETAVAVHQEAHGLVPHRIIPVDLDAIVGFLGGGSETPNGAALLPSGDQLDSAFRTILFTDLVGSTSLTSRVGDAEALAYLRIHNAIVRDALARYEGREVKHTGDGIMASFVSASAAVTCAVEIQRGFARYNENPRGEPLRVRVGLSAGEPLEEGNDLFGSSVQLAARACDKADADQILVADVVAELGEPAGFPFVDQGRVPLKGFSEPARLHAVAWR